MHWQRGARTSIVFLFDLSIRYLQHAGAIAGLGLIAMDGKILVYLRAVIVEGVLCAVQSYIRIRHKPFFVAIAEDLVERVVQHFFHGNAFHIRHFRIAIAENEIHAAAVLVKDKLYHAECQRHIVQQAAFFQHTQGTRLRFCQPYFCAQAAMAAQAAFAPLKSVVIRHGINAVIADIYNVSEEDREKSCAAGMNGHPAKPVSVEIMMKTIDQTIQ